MNQRISLRDVEIALNEKIVGGCESASVSIKRTNVVAHEGASYMPVEIVGGAFDISGEISRAFLDVDLLNDIMPKQAVPPSFTLTGTITSGKTPGRKITIFGAVFDSVDIEGLGLTDYAKNKLPFKALDWKFAK